MPLSSLKFTDRRTYFNFVRSWKGDYNRVSSDIRALNQGGKGLMRAGKYAGQNQRACISLASQATLLLKVRIASKVEAGRQRALNLADPDSNSMGASKAQLSGQENDI